VKYSHTGQSVRDIAVARRFYVEVLGFEDVMDLELTGAEPAKLMRMREPVEFHAAYLRRDGFVLELLSFAQPEPLPARERSFLEPGLTHISIGVDDLDATCAKVVEFGGAILEDSRLPGAVMVTDPDGQTIELLAGHHFADRLHQG